MQHLDVKHCNGNFQVQRVDRKFNASDMLTHSPSAEELRKFLPLLGCHTMTVKKENLDAVKTMLKRMYSIPCEHGGDVQFVKYSGESFHCC